MMHKILLLSALLLVSPAAAQVPSSGGSATGTGYPSGANPVTASTTGTTGLISATLPGAVGRVTFICGFVLSNAPGASATGAAVTATVSGTLGSTLNFAYEGVTTGQGLLGVAFPVCIPGSAPNTAIVVTLPSVGTTAQTAAVTAWGYQL